MSKSAGERINNARHDWSSLMWRSPVPEQNDPPAARWASAPPSLSAKPQALLWRNLAQYDPSTPNPVGNFHKWDARADPHLARFHAGPPLPPIGNLRVGGPVKIRVEEMVNTGFLEQMRRTKGAK
ncbi:uncharacterized protein VTP21DRAFT_4514 [Calcarisporiella thermophila]|uniref:uncharacterized protein n=1 Tax=Calcarisporiella thermophila TaxID=911321 RepID=UPI0037442185